MARKADHKLTTWHSHVTDTQEAVCRCGWYYSGGSVQAVRGAYHAHKVTAAHEDLI